jgi:hypothetical protein
VNSHFAPLGFPDLELSQRPAEREAQLRVLKSVFSVLQQRHLEHQTLRWSFLKQVAETPAIAAAVDELVAGIAADEDFGSFQELQARRDATGVARLHG